MLKKLFFAVLFFSVSVLVSLFCLLFLTGNNTSLLKSSLYTLFLLLTLSLMAALYKKRHPEKRSRWRILRDARQNAEPKEWCRGARMFRRRYSRRRGNSWYLVAGDRASCEAVMTEMSLMPSFAEMTAKTRRGQWVFFPRVVFWFLPLCQCLPGGKEETCWRRFLRRRRLPVASGILLCVPVPLLQGEVSVLRQTLKQWQQMLSLIPGYRRGVLPVHLVISGCEAIPGFSPWTQALCPEARAQALGGGLSVGGGSGEQEGITAFFDDLAGRVAASLPGCWPARADDHLAGTLLALPQHLRALSAPVSVALSLPGAVPAENCRSLWLVSGYVLPFTDGTTRQCFLQALTEQHLPGSGPPPVCWHPAALTAVYALGVAVAVSACMVRPLLCRNMAGRPPDAVVSQLLRTERAQSAGKGWQYGVFYPLLKIQQAQGERALLTLLQAEPGTARQARLRQYQARFQQAAPEVQRDMILALARSIHVWQSMRADLPLADLLALPALPAELRAGDLPLVVTPRLQVAVQNAWSHRYPAQAAQHIAELQDTLVRLLDSDPQLTWLLAPVPGVAPVSATQVGFPLALSVPVPGVWTQAGQQQVAAWLSQIRPALGTERHSAVLQDFLHRRVGLQQDAWFRLMLSMTTYHFDAGDRPDWRRHLDAIVRHQGWATRFAQRVTQELQAVPDNRASPWLKTLRQLSREPLPADGRLYRVRMQIARWLKLPVKEVAGGRMTPEQRTVWKDWQADLQAVALMVRREPLSGLRLTEGVFGVQGTAASPFTPLFSRFEQFRQTWPSSPSSDAVWQLYLSEARFLLADGLFQAACELQQAWQTKVLWVNQSAGVKDRADFVRRAIPGFLQGSAAPYLRGQSGFMTPLEAQGYSLPFTREFLHFVNNVLRPEDLLPEVASERQVRQESRQIQLQAAHDRLSRTPVVTQVTSLPATVPAGGTVLPTGTRLALLCDDDTMILSSLNFRETMAMVWRPGGCQAVELTVRFPGFDALVRYEGDRAWPDFLQDFARGEHLYPAADFDTGQGELAQAGIRSVLVRYRISGSGKVQDTWQAWSATAVPDGESLPASGNNGEYGDGLPSLPAVIAQCPWNKQEKELQ
ncbi:TPA: hypothetical protein G8O00_000937 [Salmonella enterica]|uniref:Type VI secretion system component TssM1 N-terminal domain-containing protein n=1 Tax=Salmonella enterica TaxID=28901 RepID=A0A747SP62_SALER|nr:hypothetical protein [Salmonella enterica]